MNSTTGQASASTRPQGKADASFTGDVLVDRYNSTRALTEQIVSAMQVEDMQLQSMPDASPAKWHLAHTTWFFETFILKGTAGVSAFDENYQYLFNSYYNSVGDQFLRPQRGMLSRPDVAEILDYRRYVDEAMRNLLEDLPDLAYLSFDGKLREIGNNQEDCEFCFDNETPRHTVFNQPFKLANRPISNGEYQQFIDDGGYRNPLLWLSDGWSLVQGQDLTCPGYWYNLKDGWFEYTLAGLKPLNLNNPVCHINYYEASAFAAWAGKRLPTELEWEIAAVRQPASGNVLDLKVLHPRPAEDSNLSQMYGDVWEWTSSAYGAYPGFKPAHGALGEYNGKFMCGQYVLRGGSCATPHGHIRPTYRNFFYPHSFWQFSGIRLAADN